MKSKQETNTPAQANSTPADTLSKMNELIGRKDEINERIQSIQSEFGSIFMKQSHLNSSIRELKNRLMGMPEKDAQYVTARQELDNKLQQQIQALAQTEDENKQLNEELNQLQLVELPACMVSIGAKDVIEHQHLVNQASGIVANIQAAIDSQNQFLEQTLAAIPKIADKQQERRNLLADIALGNACDADLKKLDAAIATEQKTVSDAKKEVAPLLDNARATVSGLGLKLETAKKTLNDLEAKSSEVEYRYFMGEAEKAGVQYVNAALQLKEQYFRLLGLNTILAKHDSRGINIPAAKTIQIPTFRLPQFEGLVSVGASNLLDGDRIYSDHMIEAANTEKLRLVALLVGATK